MSIWDSIGGIAKAPFNMIDSFMHPERGYDAAAKKMEEARARGQGYQQPFLDAGTGQINKLTGAEDALLDPAALEAKWAQTYNMSPEAKQAQDYATNSGMNAASSMGLMGSSAGLQNIQKSSADIMMADRSNYMKNLMQKYLAGIGIGSDMFKTGASTAGNMANQEFNYGENAGQMAFGKTNAPGNQAAEIAKLIASIYSGGGAGGGGAASAGSRAGGWGA